jgi:O-antigen/teichoic acid export membrane protein
MSRFHQSSEESLRTLRMKCFKYLTIIGVLLAGLVAVYADVVVVLAFGAGYAASGRALQILMLSFLLISINGAFIQVLASTDRQVGIMKICGLAAAINVVLNMILIPRFSYVGSATAAVISELWITVGSIGMVSKTMYRVPLRVMGWHLLKLLGAAAAGGLCLAAFRSVIPWPVNMGLASLIYLGGVWVTRAWDREDFLLFREAIQGRFLDSALRTGYTQAPAIIHPSDEKKV